MKSEAVAGILVALSGFAWPIAAVTVALLFRRFIAKLLSREIVSVKIAGMELSVAEAAKQTGTTLTDLIERMADLEDRTSGDTSKEPQVDLPHEKHSSKYLSVLWVDDFPSNNAFLIEKFERDSFRVRKELSTRAGLAALRQEPFDVIISDLGRREDGVENPLAGLDFVKEVRASGILVPILIFAGQRGLENRDRLIEAGANEVTASPVDVFRFVTERGS